MALNSQLLTLQISTNDVQVLILCLFYFITTVICSMPRNSFHYFQFFQKFFSNFLIIRNIIINQKKNKIFFFEKLKIMIFKFYHNSPKSSSMVLVLVSHCFICFSSAHISRKSKSLLGMMYF